MSEEESGSFLVYIVIAIVSILLIMAIVWVFRWFSNATTPVEVISPVKGVQCVKIVTADGAAVDCWKG